MTQRTSVLIDCDGCIGQTIGVCPDCVVTYLCDREPTDALVIDFAEERALRLLADAALVPALRHTPRVAVADIPAWPANE